MSWLDRLLGRESEHEAPPPHGECGKTHRDVKQLTASKFRCNHCGAVWYRTGGP